MKPYKENGWLASEIEVDAKIVLCAMRGGYDAIMEWGFRNRHLFNTTSKLTKRVDALKKMPPLYIESVSERAAELEIEYPSIIP